MGLFKNIFKKKEGGTLLGNIVRKVGDTVTGGMVSNLMPKPTASDFDENGNFTGGIFGGKLRDKLGINSGTTAVKVPVIPTNVTALQKSLPITGSISYGDSEPTAEEKQSKIIKIVGMVTAGLALVGGIIYAFKSKGKKRGRR